MEKLTVHYTINGEQRDAQIEPNRTLLEVVREELGLTGAKEGCGTGDCGACSMIVDGKLVSFFADNVLYDQEFIKSEQFDGTVGDLVRQLAVTMGENIGVVEVSRVAVGEGG